MAQKQIQTPSKIAKQHTVERTKKPQEVQVDVEDALLDDEHPKDTIRGGPIDRNSPRQA